MADVSILETFDVERGAFETAGEASATIKRTLKRLGVDAGILRRVAVATYEVELNLIIHSLGGRLELAVDENWVRVTSSDRGPGIPDIDKAMTEGYSTAPEDVRTLGFGAGMGLPNMKRNADDFDISSVVGVGTKITMTFNT